MWGFIGIGLLIAGIIVVLLSFYMVCRDLMSLSSQAKFDNKREQNKQY